MKVKGYLMLLIIGITTAVSAQENKISFGIEVTPALTDWRYKISDENPLPEVVINSRDHGKVGGTMGVFASYNMTEKWSASVGLNYYLSGVQTEVFDVFVPYIEDDDLIPESIWTNYNIHYLTVPLRAKLRIIPSFYIRGGIDLAFSLRSEAVSFSQYNDRLEKSRAIAGGRNPLNLNVNLGIGYQFNLGQSILAYIEPCYNMSFFSITDEGLLKEFPYYVGITFGVELQ